MTKNGLLKAIEIAGGQSGLAKLLGIKQGQISGWVRRDKKAPPPEYVLKIERLTGVSRHLLRPDVFGEASNEK